MNGKGFAENRNLTPDFNANSPSFSFPVISLSEFQFWIFVFLEIPSLGCSIYLLWNLLRKRKLRRALNNHVIIVLLFLVLFIESCNNPFYIDGFRHAGQRHSFEISARICLLWWFFDYGAYGSITVLLAWASVERYFLVFHFQKFFRRKIHRFVFHYFPLISISFYLFFFYASIIFFPPCENKFRFDLLGCGLHPCYEDLPIFNFWDNIFHGIVCSSIEMLFTIALLFKIIWQTHQILHRRRHRRIALQLLSLTVFSLLVVVPQSFIILFQSLTGQWMKNFGKNINSYLFYFYSYFVFFFPFICLANLPELWIKSKLYNRQRNRQVAPLVFFFDNQQNVRVQ